MSSAIRRGDVIAGRYRMVDLLKETDGGWFWRAHDQVLARHVAFHVIGSHDRRAPLLLDAAKRSATVVDARVLRVLDADERDDMCYVVNEWGSGRSLDLMLEDGPLPPRRSAWIASEVSETIAEAHARGEAHGRLVPENVLIDHNGSVRIIGFAVDAALHGLPPGRRSQDVIDLAGILYAALVGKWPGVSRSAVPAAPVGNGHPLRPRQVRAGIPRALDVICDQVLGPPGHASPGAQGPAVDSAAGIHRALAHFVGDGEALEPADPDETAAWPMPVPLTEPIGEEPESEEPESEEPESEERLDPDETVVGVPVLEPPWRSPRPDRPPPPPAFEEPAARPLYDPDPVRRPRPERDRSQRQVGGPASVAAASSPDREDDAAGRAARRRERLAMVEAYGPHARPEPPEPEPTRRRVPGRTLLRIAAFVALAALVLVAAVFAFTLGRGEDPGSSDAPNTVDGASEDPSESPAAAPVEVAAVDDFDPQGDEAEQPDETDLAVDGDPATGWATDSYEQNFGPRGLKDGVGLVLDLGQSRRLAEVAITFAGAPTTVAAYLSERPPSGEPTTDPTAQGTADAEDLSLELPEDAAGRYLLVWLTALPEVDEFRGEIREIELRA